MASGLKSGYKAAVRKRSFPALGTEVSELALGTWGLSGDAYGPIAQREADAVIDRSVELGITLFDTADVYAEGGMERRLGARLRDTPNTVVVTRIGTRREGSSARKCFDLDYLKDAFQKSQERLARQAVDVCLLHNPSVVTVERGEANGFLQERKEKGELRAWGVSAGSREVALAAVEAGADVLSITYNLFCSRELHAVAGEVAMRGVTVLAHSVLAYGLLTSHWGPDRTFDEGDHRRERWTPAELRRRINQLEVVRNMVGGDVMTPRSAALRFVLSNSLVTTAVLGPRTTAQLEQLLREGGKGPPYLTDSVLSELPSRLIAVGVHT